MNVWVLMESGWEYLVVGVYATLEAAKAAQTANLRRTEIDGPFRITQ